MSVRNATGHRYVKQRSRSMAELRWSKRFYSKESRARVHWHEKRATRRAARRAAKAEIADAF